MSTYKGIKHYFTIYKAKQVALFFLLLLAPTNFFLIWRTPESYYSGIFIEYWAPKLYATHFFVAILASLEVLENISQVVSRGGAHLWPYFRLKKISLRQWRVISLCGVIILSQILSSHPRLGIYHLLSFATGSLFILAWLVRNTEIAKKSLSGFILISTSFQAILGIIQWVLQKNLLGYWFLGEPTLSSSVLGTSTSQFFPTATILPYGTTPHPNILATWMLLGIVALKHWNTRKYQLKTSLALVSIFLTTLLLTESITAWITLPFVLFFISFPEKLSRGRLNKFFLALACLVLGIFWTILPALLSNTFSHPSITRRSEGISFLLQQPSSLFHTQPEGITGHIALYSRQREGSLGWKFLQPVHNIPVMVFVDMGIWTTILLTLFITVEYFIYSNFFIIFPLFLPFLYLDHYILSTNSGQFIFALVLYFLIIEFNIKKPRVL